jgi:two-component system cell cycle sensor histidine kinase/response regulator CckA
MFRRDTTYPEAVLVVDDDPFFLQYAGGILRSSGYYVLSAGSPGDAMEIESIYPGEIRLLLSDVMMPDMTGPDLAAALAGRRHRMKVLLMSACDAFHRPSLQPGWRFLHKPFGPEALAETVNSVLSVEGSDVPAEFESAGASRGNLASISSAEHSRGLHV